MEGDPFYRNLVDKHGNMKSDGGISAMTTTEDKPEVMSEEQVKEAIANVTKAIAVTEGKVNNEKLKMNTTTQMINREAQLNATMAKMLRSKMEVAEVYSPPRVVAMAKQMGLRQGWSLDLTTNDTDGRRWDFNHVEM